MQEWNNAEMAKVARILFEFFKRHQKPLIFFQTKKGSSKMRAKLAEENTSKIIFLAYQPIAVEPIVVVAAVVAVGK